MPVYKVGWSCRYVGTTEVEAESLMDAVESFTPDPLNQTSENVYKVRSVRIIDPQAVTRDNIDSFNEDNSIRREDALRVRGYEAEEVEPSPIDTNDIDGNYSVDKRFENQADNYREVDDVVNPNKWAIKERKSTPYYP